MLVSLPCANNELAVALTSRGNTWPRSRPPGRHPSRPAPGTSPGAASTPKASHRTTSPSRLAGSLQAPTCVQPAQRPPKPGAVVPTHVAARLAAAGAAAGRVAGAARRHAVRRWVAVSALRARRRGHVVCATKPDSAAGQQPAARLGSNGCGGEWMRTALLRPPRHHHPSLHLNAWQHPCRPHVGQVRNHLRPAAPPMEGHSLRIDRPEFAGAHGLAERLEERLRKKAC